MQFNKYTHTHTHTHTIRIYIAEQNRSTGQGCKSCSWSAELRKYFSLYPFAPENLVSRDGFGSPVPHHQPAHLHNQSESAYHARFLPSSAAASIYLFKPAIRHRVSPEFIGSRNCVPMAFTACGESAGKGQFRTSAALAGHHRPINMRLSFPHPLLV